MVHIFQQIGSLTARLTFIILLFSSGCSPWHADKLSLTVDEPEEIFLEEVPFFKQGTYQCGPSSLAMVLAWSGLELAPDDLTDDVYADISSCTEKMSSSVRS